MRYFTRLNFIMACTIGIAILCGMRMAGTLAQPPSADKAQNKPLSPAAADKAATDPFAETGTAEADRPGEPTQQASPDGGSAPIAGGMSSVSPGGMQNAFSLVTSEGQVAHYTASRLYYYQLLPGAAKPRRTQTAQGAGYGGGGYGMGGMGGMGGYGMDSYGGGGSGMGMGGMGGYGASGAEPITLWAYVFDTADESAELIDASRQRAAIKVVVPKMASADEGSMSGSPGGDSVMPGAGGFGVPMMQLLEDSQFHVTSNSSTDPNSSLKKLTKAELKLIAQLVRLDIWIQDARLRLKNKREKAVDFAAVEEHLKSLLDEEYEAQLVKQRTDIAKMRERLEKLQSDLERRAKAKERVVNVQLGQMVLEAQGLLGDQR